MKLKACLSTPLSLGFLSLSTQTKSYNTISSRVLILVLVSFTPLIAGYAAGANRIIKGLEQRSKSVKLFFEENGRDINPQYVKIIVYLDNGKGVNLPVKKNSFVFPLELQSGDKLSVRIIWNKHNVKFDSISPEYFDNKWIIGFDSYPFDKKIRWLAREEARRRPLYYVEMSPSTTGGIVRVVQ